MEDLRKRIGQRLQDIRGSRDQRTFAEAVDSVQQTISKYERGEIPRSWLFLARLVEEEGVDLNRLLASDARVRRAERPEEPPQRESGNGGRNGREGQNEWGAPSAERAAEVGRP